MKFPKAYNKDKTCLNVIIETPYKSRNKFNYDEETGLFKLGKVIPAGLEFPCDMGFIPHTRGEDGDPLDALVLMDEITYPGCLIECRLLGVIEATQVEDGKKIRNDRFITVPANMVEYDHLEDVADLNKHKVKAIARFFENYTEAADKHFKLLGIGDHKAAHKRIKKSKK